jgi:flavin-dependent dehydrogenase
VVVGGSLVGLSAAIALSRLGMDVTVLERSPARAVDGGGGLGVDVALLRQVTGIRQEPPVRGCVLTSYPSARTDLRNAGAAPATAW